MNKIKSLLALLAVLVCGGAWAVDITITNGDKFVHPTGGTISRAAGRYTLAKLNIPTTEGLSAGDLVQIKKLAIAFNDDGSNRATHHVVLEGVSSEEKSSDLTISGESNVATYSFSTPVYACVGTPATLLGVNESGTSDTFRARVIDGQDKKQKAVWAAIDGGTGANNWVILYKMVVEKVSEETVISTLLANDNSDVLVHLDASSDENFEFDSNGLVTKWKDVSGNQRDATPSATYPNNVTKNGAVEVVNGCRSFQMGDAGSGIDLGYTRMTNIRTVFWVMDIANNANAFFLGDTGNGSTYNFHRGTGAQIAYNQGEGILGNTNTKIYCDSREQVQKANAKPLPGHHVYSAVLSANSQSNCLSQDRDQSGRNGGRAISELIAFNRVLTDSERVIIENYLMRKWKLMADGYKNDTLSIKLGTRCDNGNGYYSYVYSTDGLVGAYPAMGKYWNHAPAQQVNSGTYSKQVFLTDGQGVNSGVSVTWWARNDWHNSKGDALLGNANARMTRTFVDYNMNDTIAANSSKDITFDGKVYTLPAASDARCWQVRVDNIPYTKYDVYAIVASGANGDNYGNTYAPMAFRVGDGEWKYYRGNNGTTVEATDNNQMWSGRRFSVYGEMNEGENYLKIRVAAASVSDDVSTLHITHGGSALPIAAIQIVSAEDYTDGESLTINAGETQTVSADQIVHYSSIANNGTLNIEAPKNSAFRIPATITGDTSSIGVIGGGMAIITKDVPASGSLTITEGKLMIQTTGQQKLNGNIVVEEGAGFVSGLATDGLRYDNSNAKPWDVFGELDMGYSRWTIGSNNVLNFYPGSVIKGLGQVDNSGNGAFDFYQSSVVNFKTKNGKGGVVDYRVKTRLRGQPVEFKVEKGVVVNVSAQINTGTANTLTKSGEGSIKFNSASVLAHHLSVTGGHLDLSAISGSSAATVITKNLTLASGTILHLPAGLEAGSAYTLCAGTLTATDGDYNIYVGTQSMLATLTFDATAKTVSYSKIRDAGKIYWKTGVDWDTATTFYMSDENGDKDTAHSTTCIEGDTVVFDATDCENDQQIIYINHAITSPLSLEVADGKVLVIGHEGDGTGVNLPSGSNINVGTNAKLFFCWWNNTWTNVIPIGDVEINGGTWGISPGNAGKTITMGTVTGTSHMVINPGETFKIASIDESKIDVPAGCVLNKDTTSEQGKTVYTVSVSSELTAAQLNQLPSTLSVGNITLTVDAVISAKTLNSIGGNVTVTLKPGAGDKYVPYSKIKNLTLGSNVKLAYDWNASRVISMSFGSGEANAEMTGDTVDGTLGGNVKRSAWNNISAASGTVAVPNGYQNGTTEYHVSGMSATITCRGNYRTNSAKNYPFMKGYLDDNNNNTTATTIALNGVPFKTYDLVIYCQSDGTGNSFAPVKIQQGEEAKTYRYDTNGAVVETEDTSSWGSGDRDFSYEYNTIRITGLSGQAVTITSNKAANNSRSCFAAVQVVQTSTDEEDAELGTTVATVDGTEYKTLGAAVDAASAKITAGAKTATVTLVSDLVATAEVVPAGVIIECDGHALTGSLKLKSGAMITENGEVKIDGIATSLDVTYGSGTINECLKYSAFGGLSECNGNSPEYTEAGDAIKLAKNPWLKNVEEFFTTTEQITFATAGIMPTANNTIFAHMGSKNTWGLFLATGTEADQVIVGYNQGATPNTITTINVPNARTHRHTYIITKDDDLVSNPTKTTFTIYLDGVKWKTFVRTPRFEITGGFQVGSTFEGIITGYSAAQSTEATAYVNFIRAYQRIISKAEIDAYTEAYPYTSPNGTYERTIDTDGNWISSAAWTSGETTVDKPSVNGNVKLTATHADETEATEKTVTVNLTEAVKYEKLTLEGDPMTFSRESASTEPIKSVCTVIGTTVTLNEGAIDLTAGPTILVEGGKLVFDFSSLTEAVVAAHPIAEKVTGDIEEDENIDNPTLAKVVVRKPSDTHINVRLEYIDGCYWVKADGVGFKGTSVGDDNGAWDYSNTPIIWTGANADVKTGDTTYTRTIGSQGLKYTLGAGYTSVKVSMIVDIPALNDNAMLVSAIYKNGDATQNVNLKYDNSIKKFRFVWAETSTTNAGDPAEIAAGKHLVDVVFTTNGASVSVDGTQVISAPNLKFSNFKPAGDIMLGSYAVSGKTDYYHYTGLKLYSATIICGNAEPTEDPFVVPAVFTEDGSLSESDKAKLALEFLNAQGQIVIPGAYKVDGGAVIANPAEIRELASLIGGNDCSSAVNFAMPFVAPEQTADGNTMKVAINLSHNVTGNVTLCVGTSPDGANTVVDTKSNPASGVQTFTLNSISTQMGEGKVLYFKVKAAPVQ